MTPPPAAAATVGARTLRRQPTPPRARAAAGIAQPATQPRPTRRGRTAPALPRRISGPVRARARAGTRAHTHLGIERLLVPHRLLDRLIRGRAWIGIVAFALIGIVAMQLWIVKLGVGIGRAIEHEGLLRRENSTLSIANSGLASGERVERLAAAKGMVEAAPGDLHFDSVRGALDARLAAATLARDQSGQTATTTGSQESGAASAAGGEASQSTTGASEETAAQSPSASEAATDASGETTASGTASGETASGEPAGASAAGEAQSTAEAGGATSGATPSASQTAPATEGVAGASTATGVQPQESPGG